MMKILLTGATGFLGRIVYNELSSANEVITLGRNGTEIISRLDEQVPTIPEVDVVIHAMGKAHLVPKTQQEIDDFHKVNVQGTRNLLSALEMNLSRPKSFVFISSVSVYGRQEGNLIDENTPLLATDPYGKSKINAEKDVQEWCVKNNVICTILRLPLLVGPSPVGNLKAMITGIKKGYYFDIDGGRAKKSMVLAEDVASIILHAAGVGGIFNLTDRYHPSFSELSSEISKQLNLNKPLNMPYWFAYLLALPGDLLGKYAPINRSKLKKITADLTFDDQRAVSALNWSPRPVLNRINI